MRTFPQFPAFCERLRVAPNPQAISRPACDVNTRAKGRLFHLYEELCERLRAEPYPLLARWLAGQPAGSDLPLSWLDLEGRSPRMDRGDKRKSITLRLHDVRLADFQSLEEQRAVDVFGRATSVPRNARSLRVLIVIENTSYAYDTRVRNISRTLAQAGCRVWVLCPRYAGDPFARTENNITIVYFPLPPLPAGIVGHLDGSSYCSVAIALGSMVLFCATRFDVIHICNPPDIFLPLGAVYRLLGRRFVFRPSRFVAGAMAGAARELAVGL